MSKLTKNRKTALAKVETGKVYKLGEAAALLKEITFTKFDASVDLDVRLGVDPRKSNQMVRGVVPGHMGPANLDRLGGGSRPLKRPHRKGPENRYVFWCSALPIKRTKLKRPALIM